MTKDLTVWIQELVVTEGLNANVFYKQLNIDDCEGCDKNLMKTFVINDLNSNVCYRQLTIELNTEDCEVCDKNIKWKCLWEMWQRMGC